MVWAKRGNFKLEGAQKNTERVKRTFKSSRHPERFVIFDSGVRWRVVNK